MEEEEEQQQENPNHHPNVPACNYCLCEERNRLIQCNICHEYFCNQRIHNRPNTHFMFHLQRRGHREIRIYPFIEIIRCRQCNSSNIFNLFSIDGQIKCNECSLNVQNRISLIRNNNLLFLEQQMRDHIIEQNQIIRQEDMLEDMENTGPLPRVKDRYQTYVEYYGTYRLLLDAEKTYRTNIIANQEPIQVNIRFRRDDEGNLYGEFPYPVNANKIRLTVMNHLLIRPIGNPNINYIGLIIEVRLMNRITVVISQSNHAIPENGTFEIKEEMNAISFNRMLEALRNFCYYNKSVSRYIFNQILGLDLQGINPSLVLRNQNVIETPNINLDQSQQQAVLNSLRHPLSLITGPPGTGKTHVATAIVYNFYNLRRHGYDKILVCSPSNVAADNLFQNLQRLNINVIRVLSKSRELLRHNNHLNGDYLHLLLERTTNPRFRRLLQLRRRNVFLPKKDYYTYKKLKKALERQILSDYDVVISTCITSLNDSLVEEEFAFVIIDESTQANETECLVPITHHTKRVVLIGDEKQLGPIIFNPRVSNAGLHKSMFERLKRLNVPETLLINQARMHPRIALFPSQTFYNNLIQNRCTAQERTDINVHNNFIFRNIQQGNRKLIEKEPTLFFHIIGEERYGANGTSLYNPQEARIVYSMVLRLFNLNVSLRNIGIITPYTEQKTYLLNLFNENENEFDRENEDIHHLEIASVDGFQGKEKDYMFISCVRSNEMQQIGFFKDRRRVNVALTRAKKGLIIVGNANCLYESSELWENLIRNYSERGILVGGNDIEHIDLYQVPNRNVVIPGEEKFNWEGNVFNFNDGRIWDDFYADYRNRYNFFNEDNNNRGRDRDRGRGRGRNNN